MDGTAGLCCAADDIIFHSRRCFWHPGRRSLLGPAESTTATGEQDGDPYHVGIRDAGCSRAHPIASLQPLDLSRGAASVVDGPRRHRSHPERDSSSPSDRAASLSGTLRFGGILLRRSSENANRGGAIAAAAALLSGDARRGAVFGLAHPIAGTADGIDAENSAIVQDNQRRRLGRIGGHCGRLHS